MWTYVRSKESGGFCFHPLAWQGVDPAPVRHSEWIDTFDSMALGTGMPAEGADEDLD